MSCNLRHEPPPPISRVRASGHCDRVFVALVLGTLVHATGVCAGEQAPVWGGASNPDFKDLREPASLSTWSFPVPATFRPLDLRAPNVPATRDFRAHLPPPAPAANFSDAIGIEPMIRDTPVWQRLEEFRARNRVRLVTLWETGGNSLSLQAGRRGDPTLQWTSRLSTHGRISSGLLDELFSTSVGGVVGRGLHFAPRSSTSEPSGKPGKSMDASLAGIGGGPIR